MAHEIDMTTGEAAIFAVGQPPWHGLGTVIEKAANSRDAIRLARLDWTVEQWPLTAAPPEDDNGVTASVHDHVANVRTDTRAVLGVVGRGYHVFQNREAFDFMDAIVGDKLAMYETAGGLKGGRKVWMLARIPKEYRAGPEDLIKPYVLLVNSHDGSAALRMIPTTVRVVCQNTLNLALRQASGGEGLAIRHRPSLDARVKDARAKLGIVAARFDRFDEELHAMLATPLKPRQVESYFDGVLPAEPLPPASPITPRQLQNRAESIDAFRRNFDDDSNRLPGVRGTAWAAYNAVSEWADHQRPRKGATALARAESRLDSVWFGSSHQIKQRAYAGALQLAGVN
jgi:phage/plasmid-like protein (TIGR03299 family)